MHGLTRVLTTIPPCAPSCPLAFAAGTFSSYLTQASSPAAEDAAVNNGTAAAGAEWVCQNGVPL